jgi:hypothetical protein
MKIQYETELYHFGIKGMKWYRRRYQEEDGSLTPAGRARYANQQAKQSARVEKYEARAARYNARAAKKEAGFISKRGLFESKEHYNSRVITKQGKAASDKARAAEYAMKAQKASAKLKKIDRELNMKTDGKSLPQARMTDSKKTYEARVRKSEPFQKALKTAENSGNAEGLKKLKSEMPGLTRKEQKLIVKIYRKTLKAQASQGGN